MGDQVSCLKELNLAGNQLTTLPRHFSTGALAKSLRQLNLSSNQIELLPNFTCSLAALLHLNLAKNKLRALPPAFARLSQLQHLDASHNMLCVLPGGVARLRLDNLELSGNNFSAQEPRVLRDRLEVVPSLLETSARFLRTSGVSIPPDEVAPQLLAYLDSGVRCLCSKPVWNSVVTAIGSLDLHRVATSVSANGKDSLPMEVCLCSSLCLQKFRNNPYAS